MDNINKIMDIPITTKEIENLKEKIILNYLNRVKNPFVMLLPPDVSKDLNIGINQAYDLFKQDDFPTVTVGNRKLISIASYLLWKMGKKEADQEKMKN